MPASLYTHVIEVPAATTKRDGKPRYIRRTGTRKPRHEVGKDCLCGTEECTNGQA